MKQPLVSVIVPTYNSEAVIGACLQSIQDQTYPQVELIVVDNYSTDQTPHIAAEYTQYVYQKGPERSAQRNYGAKQAKGQYVLFIDSDMRLTPEVVAACVNTITEKQKTLLAITIPEESIGTGFWAQAKRLERQLLLGVDWLEAPRFFPKKIFAAFHGYDETNTGTEDYDLPQRIKMRYGNSSIGRITSFIQHNEGHLSLLKTMKKKFYYAEHLQSYTQKQENKQYYKKQASLVNRYMLFFSQPSRLFQNPVLGIGMLFLKTMEFTAGGMGLVVGKIQKNV